MRLLQEDGLQAKGIPFTRSHLHRLIRSGKFPAPVKIGDNRNAWVEEEIDAYIAERVAARGSEAPRQRGKRQAAA